MSAMSDVQRSEEPMTRLTRLAGAMVEALEAHPEFRPGDRFVVMLDQVEPDEDDAGIAAYGFGDEREIPVLMLESLRGMLKAIGINLEVKAQA